MSGKRKYIPYDFSHLPPSPLTPEAVAERLNIPVEKVREHIKAGALRAVWFGKRTPRIHEAAIEEFVRTGGKPPAPRTIKRPPPKPPAQIVAPPPPAPPIRLRTKPKPKPKPEPTPEEMRAQKREEKNKRRRSWFAKRRVRDPIFRLNRNTASAVRASLCGEKNRRPTFELLGYSVEALKAHLEAQFLEGMSWENYGPAWHVDHVKPLSAHAIAGPDCPEFKAAWALSNLQPMWARDNLRKGAKWDQSKEATT